MSITGWCSQRQINLNMLLIHSLYCSFCNNQGKKRKENTGMTAVRGFWVYCYMSCLGGGIYRNDVSSSGIICWILLFWNNRAVERSESKFILKKQRLKIEKRIQGDIAPSLLCYEYTPFYVAGQMHCLIITQILNQTLIRYSASQVFSYKTMTL